MHEFRQVALLGLILGIILEAAGFVSLVNYFANDVVYNYLLGGIGVIVVGIMFLAKSVPVFIPIKQQQSVSKVCPNCAALIEENANSL